LQSSDFHHSSHCKAKAIGSNPLAGFPSQIPSSPVVAGLINGLMNGTTVELNLQRPFGSDFDDFWRT